VLTGGDGLSGERIESRDTPDSGLLTWAGHLKHLIEITIEQVSVPTDADQVSTHQIGYSAGVEFAVEQIKIIVEFALTLKIASKSVNRHVGDREQRIEDDSVIVKQSSFVFGFEVRLTGWEERSSGVVDQIEDQACFGMTVPEAVELF